ncbi:DUF3500 domain-containing protein [Mycobacterium sp. 1465703.0]|uniref:DUF3500 domain-containing protein n=1 Tax=Mycobacterium sp. 1465703.0 TaxID=1834078 RepID=UPI0007FC234A|nr:DUF3500 domain-containing protein [Mycobacterium sp. 1465703.0]OBJ08835.1 hypothetical protein A5625_14100 [Mycobacterium sp. 1465703.0]
MYDDSVLHHAPRHRPIDDDFNVTAVTYAAMALFDHLDYDQRSHIVVPLEDPVGTNWNFLAESGRHGVPVRDMTGIQRYLTHRLVAQCTSVERYAKVSFR